MILPLVVLLSLLVVGGYALLRYLNFHPAPIMEEPVLNDPGVPTLNAGQPIRVLTYNVQYFAGTNYSFFYDGGPDTVVTTDDVHSTIGRIAKFIGDTDADFVFLQEVDQGAKRSGHTDQIALLQARLKGRYPSCVSSYYWFSKFVPHPKVWGPVGMKLVILSKYRLGKAHRHKLASTPGKPINRDFNIKRAFLEVTVPSSEGPDLVLINTHLEAFTEGTNVLELQVNQIRQYLNQLDARSIPWILGGDFNALPPGQYEQLAPADRGSHTDHAELKELYRNYQGVPTVADATDPSSPCFFTFTVRDGGTRRAVRTLDYLFVSSKLRISDYHIEHRALLTQSDHLPLIAEIA